MSGHCPLCLKDLQEPVCIPCGHVYCSACIGSYATAHDKLKFTARCPLATCQQDFNLFIPDINALPKKFRSFVCQPMRRIHLSTRGTEDDLCKERDQYRTMVDTMRVSVFSLEERLKSSERQAEHYRRKADRMKREHEEEKKGLEARIQVLQQQLDEAQRRETYPSSTRDEDAISEGDSPRLGKRRRMSVVTDENEDPGDKDTIMANISHHNSYIPHTPMSLPDTKGKAVDRESMTPKARPKHNTTPSATKPEGYRFAFRAPSTSLLALRGPRKIRDYSIKAPRF